SGNDVVVTDSLPPTAAFVSAVSSQGTCTHAGSQVSCALGTLATGGSAGVTIVVTPIQPGLISDSVTVASANPDPDPTNNAAFVTTVVRRAPNTTYVSVTDSGFSPASVSIQFGSTVQWNFLGPGTHSAADGTGMGLYDSGEVQPVAYFVYDFAAAGAYRVID